MKCETCKKEIWELTEQEALDDIETHGWTNWQTANHIKCFDCASPYDDYETYYAGRKKKKYPNRSYRKVPDISKGSNKLIEVYFER